MQNLKAVPSVKTVRILTTGNKIASAVQKTVTSPVQAEPTAHCACSWAF